MRTTVDLPPGVHRRARELAERRGVSLSAIIADLTMRGLAQCDTPVTLSSDPRTGFPVVSLGRRVSTQDVEALLDEE